MLFELAIKLRNSKIIRFLLIPFVKLYKILSVIFYKRSKDAEYIKTFFEKYQGKRCFIIGNGPSLCSEDLNLIIGEYSFGTNRIYKIFKKTNWRPTFYLCVDKDLWNKEKKEITNIGDTKIPKFIYGNIKKSMHNKMIYKIVMYGKLAINRKEQVQHGVSKDVSKFFSNSLSVTCNTIEFAMYMGFKEIYLLGVDNTFVYTKDLNGNKVFNEDEANHFRGSEFQKQILFSGAVFKDSMDECFKVINQYALTRNIKIYNATRGGQLEVFNRINLEEITGLGNINDKI